MPYRRIAHWIAASCLLAITGAQADTVKVLTAGAFKPVVLAMVPGFEARTGHKVEVHNDTAGALAKRIAAGEAFDLVVVTPAVLQSLAQQGTVDGAATVRIAKVGIGVAVRTGSASPDMRSVEDFRHAVLQAKRLAYIDPASGGSSGIYLDQLFGRMGIADAVRAKAVLVPGGLVADRLVSGEADLAIHQISEILPVKGATLVAPLPEALQNYTEYAGALASKSGYPDAARAFLAALAGADAQAVIEAKGMVAAPR